MKQTEMHRKLRGTKTDRWRERGIGRKADREGQREREREVRSKGEMINRGEGGGGGGSS